MPYNQDTEHPRTSQAKRVDRPGLQFRPRHFSVSPWVHRWAFTGGRNATDAEMLQSARAIKRWHGGAFAPVGERNRAICDTSRLSEHASPAVADLTNDAFLWTLRPISARHTRYILAEHRSCREQPDSSPCCRAAVLEIAFEPDPVKIVPADSEEGFKESVEAGRPASSPPAIASTDSIGIGISGHSEPIPRYRSISTRYGWFTYLHRPRPPRRCSQ